MKRLKLKKKARTSLIALIAVVIFLSIGIYSYLNIQKKLAYEKTYEYKLITKGYEEDIAKKLVKNFKDQELEFILNEEKSTKYIDLINDKFFIYDNFYDYLDCSKNEESLSTRQLIEKVNTKTNYEYYSNATKTDTSKKELMLVNKYNYLEEGYTPDNLVSISQTYAYGDIGSQQVTEDTYDAFLNLWNASHDAGFYLMVNSSYRTHEKQQAVYDDYKKVGGTDYADSIAARPGYSEHQTGYSLDIFEKGYSQKTFQESDSYKWLLDNAYKYGFILRYPEDKIKVTGYDFESWHYRYVGIDAATYIHDNNITFDEYYAYFVK